jgi:hypothetical protein
MKPVVRLAVALAAVSWSVAAPAQSIDEVCEGIPAAYAPRCAAVAQTAEAIQPRLGIVIAAGNPALGQSTAPRAEGVGRFRAAGRMNLAFLHIPDITVEDDALTPQPPTQERGVLTLVVGADASMSLLRGANGVGALDLLLSASYLPFDLLGRDVYKPASAQFSVGAGARLGLLAESARTPGIWVTSMLRRTGTVQVGNACEGEEEREPGSTQDPPSTLCRLDGDLGEVVVDLMDWSTRAAIGKQLGPVALGAGVGFDRIASDVELAVRAEAVGSGLTGRNRIHHRNTELDSDRWSAFLNASVTPLAGGSIVAELGWMQGGEAVAGFPAESDFDPAAGTFFGSVGVRLPI